MLSNRNWPSGIYNVTEYHVPRTSSDFFLTFKVLWRLLTLHNGHSHDQREYSSPSTFSIDPCRSSKKANQECLVQPKSLCHQYRQFHGCSSCATDRIFCDTWEHNSISSSHALRFKQQASPSKQPWRTSRTNTERSNS